MAQVAQQVRARRVSRAAFGALWHEHGVALTLYAALTVMLSWPAVRDFSSLLVSDGTDAKHTLWIFWHTREFLLGRAHLFELPMLYYPHGISLYVNGIGPITGLLALPFWPWGPVAAHNGGLLATVALSGYCTYLLARALGFARAVSLFAGTLVLASPMVLHGLEAHIPKTFLGLLPLILLALVHALNPRRSPWWAVAVGLGVLATILHDGHQFIYAGLAIAYFVLVAFFTAPPGGRWLVLRRSAFVALACLLLAGPLLLRIYLATQDPALEIDLSKQSFAAPDLLHFVLPPSNSMLFGPWVQGIIDEVAPGHVLPIEAAVSVAAVTMVLCGLGWFSGQAGARRWIVAALGCALLALGPVLSIAGQTIFTRYELPIILPYAFLTELPGLQFMRVPGRFMALGFPLFAIGAAFGLAWLLARLPRGRYALLAAAYALLLGEVWPHPVPQEALPPTPEFYRQIAQDREQYGVFDLPIKPAANFGWTGTTAFYGSYAMYFQTTHNKGIYGGYISRTYYQHPVFTDLFSLHQSTLLIDGQPAAFRSFPVDLARNNYRYVVLHKLLFTKPGKEPSGGQQIARELLDIAFAGQPPLVDDHVATVYQVAPPAGAVGLSWGENWRNLEPEWRWAASPATLTLSTGAPRRVTLEITPAHIHDPASPGGLGGSGTLAVQVGDFFATSLPIAVDQPARLQLDLPAGTHSITLALQGGNFRPADLGMDDERTLSFAVRSINLLTQPAAP